MAEINIEPKKRSSWSWIIVLLILALVGWLVYHYFFEPQPVEQDTTTTDPTTGYVMPVAPDYFIS